MRRACGLLVLLSLVGVWAGCRPVPTPTRTGGMARPLAADPEPEVSVAHDEARLVLSDVRHVSAGAMHTCALRADGAVYCWGDNTVGQLGDATREARRTPTRVQALPPARSIAAGADSTCAATVEGSVYCWGANPFGQLGNGERSNGYSMPVLARGVEGSWKVTGSIAAPRHCALVDAEEASTTSSGAVHCWGQLAVMGANGRPVLASPEPRVEDVGQAVAVAIGSTHECALSEVGVVSCRGYGAHGELGTAGGEVRTRFAPVPGLGRAIALAAGPRHTCAVLLDGSAYCFGDDTYGQLGGDAPDEAQGTPVRVELPIAVRAVVAGERHSCALGERGDVYCWGDASSPGALRIQRSRAQASGADCAPPAHARPRFGAACSNPRPREVRLETPAQDLSAGARHTCAVLVDGEVRCWGDNSAGQLGDGTVGAREWPVAVLGGAAREAVAAR